MKAKMTLTIEADLDIPVGGSTPGQRLVDVRRCLEALRYSTIPEAMETALFQSQSTGVERITAMRAEVREDDNAKQAARRIATRYEGATTADYTCDGCGARVVGSAPPEGWSEDGKEHYCPGCQAGKGARGELMPLLAALRAGEPDAWGNFCDYIRLDDGGELDDGRMRQLGELLSKDAALATWFITRADKNEEAPFESDLVRYSAFRVTGDMVRGLTPEFITHNLLTPLFYSGSDRADKSGWQAVFARMNPVKALVAGHMIDPSELGQPGYDAAEMSKSLGVDAQTAAKWMEDARRSGVQPGDPIPTYKP